jgi:hypothetical protein
MDPLEAGERVVNGVRNNDLYILSHPETACRSPSMRSSIPFPLRCRPRPAFRVSNVLHAGIYPCEIAHRKVKRKSYRN